MNLNPRLLEIMNKLQIYKKFHFCFFTRKGGVSKKSFASLNCAFGNGDLNENVLKNREIASQLFRQKNILVPNQTHSNTVLNIRKDKQIHDFDADALVTSRNDLLLGILTADCAPIIVIGKKMFGIIHAGWKGVLDGIIENTLDEFISNGEKINNLRIFVGPHLKKESFEVKDDFIKILKNKINCSEEFIKLKKNKKFFDFSKLIESKILNYNNKNFYISEIDTFSNPYYFFSHRYCSVNKIKNCGRQISLVGIKNK